MTRSYTDLISIPDFEGRYQYLRLNGSVGRPTFGYERWLNQRFYTSREWRDLRHDVIARDLGLDLGADGYEIFGKPIIHHMNAITREELRSADHSIIDPEFLITTSLRTHNAIHFGDDRQLPRPHVVERRHGDTKLW